MDGATLSPYPHYSWLGTWTTVGSDRPVCLHLRQVSHCLFYNARGRAAVRWIRRGQERRFDADVGTVRFSPADDERHTLIGRCTPGHRFYSLFISRRHLQAIAESEGLFATPEFRHSLSRHDAVLEGCLRRISEVSPEGHDASAGARDAAARGLVLRLLEMNGAGRPDWHGDWSVFDRRSLDGLVSYIDAHLRIPPSLIEMAALVGLSPSHFSRKFRHSTGLSLHRFVNRRRLGMALTMLKAEFASIASVALDLGFSSQSHFTRLFSEVTGMTPAKYRKQLQRVVG